MGRYTAQLGGITDWAIMLLDVLTGVDTIRICTDYELDGRRIKNPPPTIAALERCKPVYIEMPGWQEDITGCRTYAELPENARKYVEKLAELTGVQIGMISVGPDRKQTIIVDKELEKF